VSDLRERLEQLAGRGARSGPTRLVERIGTQLREDDDRASTRPRWAIAAAVGVVTLLIGGAFGVVALRSGSSRRVQTTTSAPSVSKVQRPALGDLPSVPTFVAFADAHHGEGLTFHCTVSSRASVCDLGVVASDDSGRTWTLMGVLRNLRYPGSTFFPGKFVALGRNLWIYGTRTFASHDGGRTFSEEHVGGIVQALAPSSASVWAAVSTCDLCTVDELVSAPVDGGSWRRLGQLPEPTGPSEGVSLLRPTTSVAYLLPTPDTQDRLYYTHDGGRSWQIRPLPHVGVSNCCTVGLTGAALGSNRIWLLGGGSAPARTQSKFLYRSDDAAAHWTLVADTDTVRPPDIGHLALPGLINALAVTSLERIWISSPSGGTLIGTLDGGKTWFDTNLRTGGAQLVFVDPLHGWAWNGTLSYRTTDGQHWISATTPSKS
jgi:photosystem II stability/assembly factor-like uncharacterized protein